MQRAKTLGIIGLGNMGYPIAQHLLAAGYDLYTTVRSEKSRNKAKQQGIHVLASHRDFSQYVDRILILVSNYEQCKECLLGDEGIFSTLEEGIIILSSTVDPAKAGELDSLCPEGVKLVDAPISGGAIGAEKGELVAITAGDRTAVEACSDVFACYCRKTFYAGEKPGQAQAIKAINQMLVGIHITATAEAMALTKAMGIDPNAMFATISECAGNSNIFQSRMPKLIAEDFSARASLETMEKDTAICISLARNAETPCYLTEVCHDLFSKTPRSKANESDACAVVQMYTPENSDVLA